MAADSSSKKVLSRRSLFAVAGGAAGLLIAKKVVRPGAPGAPPPLGLLSDAKNGDVATATVTHLTGEGIATGATDAVPGTALALNQIVQPHTPHDPSIPLPESDRRITGERMFPDLPPPEADKRRTGERADPSIPPPEADLRITGERMYPDIPAPWEDKRITGEGDPSIPGAEFDKRLTGEGDPNVPGPEMDVRAPGELDKRVTGEGLPGVPPPVADKRLTGEGDPNAVPPTADKRIPGEPFEPLTADADIAPPEADKRLTGEGLPGVPPPEVDKRLTAEGEPDVPPAWADKRMTGEGQPDVPPREADVRKPGEAAVPTPDEDKRRLGSPDESPAEGQPAPRYLSQASPSVMDLIGPLKPGATAFGYKVVAVHDVYMGAVPVILSDKSGAHFQVDILRRDRSFSAPKSVADTEHLSVFLANDGNGRKASDESKGLGAIAVASVLSGRAANVSVPKGLLTWRERLNRYPDGDYKAPV